MTDMPLGTATPPGVTGGAGRAPDEILVAFAEPAPQNRLTVLVRIILAIPHLVVLWALGIAAEVVVIICWFAALVLGRLPVGLGEFLSGYLRWLVRVQGYLFLLTDRYPPFELGEADYPVQILVRPGPLNRLAVLFRIILAIPAALLSSLVVLGMETIVMFVTWLIVLIAGQMPRPLYEAIAAGQRYYFRYTGYLFLLTGSYPWGLFGDQPDQAYPAPASGQPVLGYGQPAPGYAEPAPGYAEPGYGQPEYQPPAGYDQPGPGYPEPAYGQPEYAQPAGYAQPAAVTGWLGGDQPWRLVLSGTAKGLVGMFLAIGVLVAVLWVVLIAVAASSNNTVSKAVAAASVQTAYAKLSTTVGSFDSKVSGCGGKLSCVNRVDSQMSQSFRTFGSDIQGISMPTPASTAAAGTVQSDADQIGTDFQRLSTASSVSQYQQTVASTGLEGLLNRFDADYRSLGRTLAVG